LLGFAAIGIVLAAVLLHGGHDSAAVAALMRGQVPIWGLAAFAVAYLLLILTFWMLIRIYTVQRVWRRVAQSCAVLNIAAASDVAAAGDIVGALGEGLADGLDFGL
ncbi:MAG TPA: hypothetical protein VJR70_09790, partial [Stellaceae bacterium]|nr:hypothetical protein [Stellaceae bacterium]